MSRKPRCLEQRFYKKFWEMLLGNLVKADYEVYIRQCVSMKLLQPDYCSVISQYNLEYLGTKDMMSTVYFACVMHMYVQEDMYMCVLTHGSVCTQKARSCGHMSSLSAPHLTVLRQTPGFGCAGTRASPRAHSSPHCIHLPPGDEQH